MANEITIKISILYTYQAISNSRLIALKVLNKSCDLLWHFVALLTNNYMCV